MKPMIFNTEMTRAILDGRKTVTRRVIKPQPVMYGFLETHFDWSKVKLPYRPGDILYVRETWNYGYCDTTDFECRCNETFFEELEPGSMKGSFLFPRYFYRTEDLDGIVGMKWRPSIHMPREAARIFLRVTDVRVERLQDINPEDIVKEGFSEVFPAGIWQADFYNEWNSTIKPKDRALYGWDANPWVWVIEFERIEKFKEADADE